MRIEEAKKIAKKYEKAEIWFCPTAKRAEVMVYTNAHSNQWFSWTGVWSGSRPTIPGCTCDHEELKHSHVYYNQNGEEI